MYMYPPTPLDTDILAPRIDLDLAKGIVMAWRGCDDASASEEIFSIARRHRVSPFRLARDLVAVVGSAGNVPAAHPIVREQWGQYLPQRQVH
jgi:hypothetical protein